MDSNYIRSLITYDAVLSCYVLHYKKEAICLGSACMDDAIEEAEQIINNWSY